MVDSSGDAVRLVLAADEVPLRLGLRVLLEAGGRIEVVAESGTGADLLPAVRAHRPAVVLLSTEGLISVRSLRGLPEPPVVAVLGDADVDEVVAAALEAGAHGFLLSDAEPESLVRAVLDLAAGGVVLDPRVAARIMPRLRSAGAQLAETRALRALSVRERQVLDLLADGRSNSAIARELGLTEATVKSYVSTLLTKLGVRNRVQAALIVQRWPAS
ncbi:response regulator transcription factor [Kutzneria viridogrisea]|uniref:Two-component system response regulator n=2 Tax=Kutzneria TaxID=43356 RepID=W5W4T8_9PSEU|nr:response regulator transcription factor [Kutzneria albida]AHH96243.1 two-component system response regulator [Kutzneria albida DSM 43870]MBA8928544.1 DNA-binding NarL/FixJ family response regulator [Kutzneria viridogrisea]